ncbi:hypothetical protein GGR92_002029 [Spirosoma lacussanchae]|uniref:hypothetical protein n=1 Tax=Spirosoma lacussanchae TaxID=1884249 RepID=UPI0011095CC9|nr:hypothetical protein [Spirosoma lacussanchae]
MKTIYCLFLLCLISTSCLAQGTPEAAGFAAVNSATQSDDAVLDYDLCASENESSLRLRYTTGKLKAERRWQFFRATDNVRMRILNTNPANYSVTLTTIGLQNDYVVNASPLSELATTPVGETPDAGIKEAAGLNLDSFSQMMGAGGQADSTVTVNRANIEEAVRKSQSLLTTYLVFLRETRRKLLAEPCLSSAGIDEILDQNVPNSTLSRTELISLQQQLLAKLDAEDQLRVDSETQLTEIQAELDQWFSLRAGSIVRGPTMPARDKDYIRFEVKKQFIGGSEVSLPVIDIPVYGNFRMNVSTGLIVSRLVDHTYLAIDSNVLNPAVADEPTSSTTAATARKVPVLEKPALATIGVGALLHCYHTRPWFRGALAPALSVGASLNATGRYTLMLGGSLIVGNSQRMVLTTGYAVGPVTRLQKPYEAAQEPYSDKTNAYDFSGAQFPTTTQTLGGWFFGLTWNMSSRRNPIAN